MGKEKSIEIIKGAILLEQKGKAFYKQIAEQTSSVAVKEFFENMVVEEESHVKILSEQLKSLKSEGQLKEVKYNVKTNGQLKAVTYDDNTNEISESVLSKEIKKEISGAGFEAAAISAALMMEEKAVTYYSDRAKTVEDELEKELFNWLANWEKGHVKLLIEIDKELQQSVWNDNQFWPY